MYERQRYQLYEEDIKYFATGVIESDGVGKVTKIDGINAVSYTHLNY